MTAVEHYIPVIWVIFNDGEFKLIKLYQLSRPSESGLVEFQNPDFAAYASACGADGYTVETVDEFERAFERRSPRAAERDRRQDLAACPPHYSPSPEGTIAGILEMIEARFRGGS